MRELQRYGAKWTGQGFTNMRPMASGEWYARADVDELLSMPLWRIMLGELLAAVLSVVSWVSRKVRS